MRRPLQFPIFSDVLAPHENEYVTRQDGYIKDTMLSTHFVPEQNGQRRSITSQAASSAAGPATALLAQRLRYLRGIIRALLSASMQRRDKDRRLASIQRRNAGVPTE